jgi:hypothetical protein
MAATHTLPLLSADDEAEDGPTGSDGFGEEDTQPLEGALEKKRIAPNSPAARLPVEVDIAVPIRGFRVRNLLSIGLGEVIETQWSNGSDLPLAAGDVQLAWSEFEVIDTQLAVRVTRLI